MGYVVGVNGEYGRGGFAFSSCLRSCPATWFLVLLCLSSSSFDLEWEGGPWGSCLLLRVCGVVAYVGARSSVESVLVGIWEGLLKRERVSVEANFFELGGHSLLATQVISRVRETFQIDVPLRILFDSPTIASLSESLLRDLEARPRIESMADLLVSLEGLSEEELDERLKEIELGGGAVQI